MGGGMSAQVTVTVSGLTGSGKSAIYGEIVLALEAIGVDVAHESERAWQSECNMTHADWQTALELYQPTVLMIEQNISRTAKATPTQSAKTTKIGLVRRMVARCRQAFAQTQSPNLSQGDTP
jgi:hypothetical protein